MIGTRLYHVTHARQFDRPLLEEELFPLADRMREVAAARHASDRLADKRMITFFYEPSTRTRASFELAMQALGGRVVFTTENARDFSSAAKGETIEDTIRILNGYRQADVIVLRHHEDDGVQRAAAVSEVPVISAGEGKGEHPTQALLDAYTLYRELGQLDNLSVGLIGDLAYGRTVHSLAALLANFRGVRLYLVSPSILCMPEAVKEYLAERGVGFSEHQDIRDIASRLDVAYVVRAQTERFEHAQKFSSAVGGRGSYVIDDQVMELLPAHAVVMHPLPRNEELPRSLDEDPRVAIFRQAANGLYVRMALLCHILEAR